MVALAEDATRSKMPVSHYVFSWRGFEQPTPLPEDKKYAPLEAYVTYRQGILKNDPELAH